MGLFNVQTKPAEAGIFISCQTQQLVLIYLQN